MTLTKVNGKDISVRRKNRIEELVAPLHARGLSNREIAKTLGLNKSVIDRDVRVLKQLWEDDLPERLQLARGELVAKHDHIYGECLRAYYDSGKNVKFLELASKQLDCLGRLLGQAGTAINLHAHQHNLTVAANAASVAELFKPLDAGTYADMVAAKVLPPSEAAPLDSDDLSKIVSTDSPGADDATDDPAAQSHQWIPAEIPDNQAVQSRAPVQYTGTQNPDADSHKSKRIRHPRG